MNMAEKTLGVHSPTYCEYERWLMSIPQIPVPHHGAFENEIIVFGITRSRGDIILSITLEGLQVGLAQGLLVYTVPSSQPL